MSTVNVECYIHPYANIKDALYMSVAMPKIAQCEQYLEMLIFWQ